MKNRSNWSITEFNQLFELGIIDFETVQDAVKEMSLPTPLEELELTEKKLIETISLKKNNLKLLQNVLSNLNREIENAEIFIAQNKNLSTSGYIYVIRSENGKYKIGKAQDVNKRLQSLQTGTPEKLELVLTIKTSNKNVLETICHRQFSSKKIRGEWFSLTDDDLNWLSNLPTL